MRVVKFTVKSYKSFPEVETNTGTLTKGINTIIGQNNAGKTALLEALTLRGTRQPHRSLKTHTHEGAMVDLKATSILELAFLYEEALGLVADHGSGQFVLKAVSGSHKAARVSLKSAGDPELLVQVTRRHEEQTTGKLISYPDDGHPVSFTVRRPDLKPNDNGSGSGAELGQLLADIAPNRTYLFSAERYGVGEGVWGHNAVLAPNATNLPEVLNRLQSNPYLFAEFNSLVRRVLPQVRWISVQPVPNNQLRVLVWNIDPESKRSDLAMPLNQSGTGVGQVLAILYVAVHSREPYVIGIDEPQSFLHPGAVRALLEILQEHSTRHQFLITTHSPVAVTAIKPDTVLHVTIEDGASRVTQLRREEAEDVKVLLADLGVRMEDLFGFDAILWVEGRTEELCFPPILRRLMGQALARVGIFALVATGDLNGRHRELAYEVYDRLSQGSVLVPPAIAFVFDRERRTDKQLTDMISKGKEKVWFLPCRMFENYLVDTDAIAHVAADIDGFGDVTPDRVREWLDRRKWDQDLFAPDRPPDEHTQETWTNKVSGAAVLQRAFAELSDKRVRYDKVKHGLALTEWLLQHKPDELRPLAEFLSARLQ